MLGVAHITILDGRKNRHKCKSPGSQVEEECSCHPQLEAAHVLNNLAGGRKHGKKNLHLCVCVFVHLQAFAYGFSEFRNSNAVGDWVAVAGVVHQHARQEHGSEVVAVQDVHRQSGGGRPPVGRVGSAVLQEQKRVSTLLAVEPALWQVATQ